MTTAPAYAVSFRFRDGAQRSIVTDGSIPLLDAALAQGLPLLYQCRSGSCCTCTAHLVAGDAEMASDAGTALLKSEREKGFRLLCRSRPRSACAFDLAYDSSIAAGAARKARVFVNALDHLAPDVMRVRLELAEDDWIDFRAGQFIQVRVPGTDAVRSYSMSSTPSELPNLDLLVRLIPGGVMSEYLRSRARVDDVLQIEGPFGAFFHRDQIKAPHVMIAGGTGLAPVLSMIDALRRKPGRKPRVLLSFGCASCESLFCVDELELRRLWLPTLATRVSVDRGAEADGIRI